MGEQLRKKLDEIRKAEELKELVSEKLGVSIDQLLIIAGKEEHDGINVQHVQNGTERGLCALVFNTFNVYCNMYPETMNDFMMGSMMDATREFNRKK